MGGVEVESGQGKGGVRWMELGSVWVELGWSQGGVWVESE